jgi:amino-acid N-acetyltransferase
MSDAITIRRAEAADYPRITRILTAADLPLDGLDGHEKFLVLCRDGQMLGCAAFERYGLYALLRSVALEPPERRGGLGRRLVQEALQQARRDGVAEVILLTTTAAPFFERLGFRKISREEVPAPVRASAEFRGACPDTAAILRLVLIIDLASELSF